MIQFEIVKGNILDQEVDVIVTAANQSLAGVLGHIHKACGKDLAQECQELGGCSTGKAKLTRSYDLCENGVGWIIHAVAPRYAGGMYFEADLLADTYSSALEITKNFRHIYEDQCMDVLNRYIGHLNEEQQKPYIDETKEEVRNYTRLHLMKTVAFPSLSTGIYGYPLKEAAYIACQTIKAFCRKNSHLEKVILVCQDNETYNMYKKFAK